MRGVLKIRRVRRNSLDIARFTLQEIAAPVTFDTPHS